jgi:serine/threonine protein kinase
MLDFGIAKHKYSPKLTQVGFVIGTMEYLAPEQFQQKEELKSDVWAMGVMAYELVTGYMPFDASNPITLRSKITKGSFTNPKILIPEISEKLITVIDKSLRINPAHRITSAEMENIIGRKKQQTNLNQFTLFNPSLKKWILPGVAGFGILFFFVMLFSNNIPDKSEKKTGNDDSAAKVQPLPVDKPIAEDDTSGKTQLVNDINDKKIKISSSNAENAVLIFPDGSTRPLPYDIHGKEGDVIRFTIHAEGFVDRKEQVEINPRRFAYDCKLDKINN